MLDRSARFTVVGFLDSLVPLYKLPLSAHFDSVEPSVGASYHASEHEKDIL